jgi:hypothetical protein
MHQQTFSGGRLALRLRGGLRANETRRFGLVSGSAPSEPEEADSVRVVETAEYYEIANALVAVRVPREISPAHSLAPIQAVRLRAWAEAETDRSSITDLAGKPLPVEDMHAAFLEHGPLVVTVEVSYRTPRDGASKLLAAGAGFYRATITLEAGQPSTLIDEDTDMEVQWALDVSAALRPDQARYQGHHATSVENGSESDGRQYRPTHERPNVDAFVLSRLRE